jgi:predicted transcriptional regulator of viral defense system
MVIMSNTSERILERINSEKYGAFTSSDFSDIDNYKMISKTLETLDDKGIIKRARRGIYYIPKYNELLGIEEAPSINEIAKAIARQYNLIIIPSGNYALNLIGLSTQVPIKYVYITNGPYNEYEVGNNTIYFKHSTSREINNLPYKILICIQALKTIGKNNIDENVIKKISCFLDDGDKNNLKTKNYKITSWIHDILKSV